MIETADFKYTSIGQETRFNWPGPWRFKGMTSGPAYFWLMPKIAQYVLILLAPESRFAISRLQKHISSKP